MRTLSKFPKSLYLYEVPGVRTFGPWTKKPQIKHLKNRGAGVLYRFDLSEEDTDISYKFNGKWVVAK